jgi:hypothetical protein
MSTFGGSLNERGQYKKNRHSTCTGLQYHYEQAARRFSPPPVVASGAARKFSTITLRPKRSFSYYLIDMALIKWVRLGQGSSSVIDLRECLVVPGNTTRLIC